jgi:DNA processing protein
VAIESAFLRRPRQLFQPGEAGYPQVLQQAASAVAGFTAPPRLSIVGDARACGPAAPMAALIGARACTPHGRLTATRIGAGLAAAGVTVISGAARGIDQAAMRGALQAGGPVVAVLGSGLARPYPPEGIGLLDAIAQSGGAVLSEFPDDLPPCRHHFPQRNRLLAALAQIVVVIEAGTRSGTMNTVGWALELGRDVAAVPGMARAPASAGPHRLLREGAHLVECAQDVLAVMGVDAAPARPASSEASLPGQDPILSALQGSDLRFDELLRTTKLADHVLRQELARLELAGRIHRQPGGAYHRPSW